MMYLYALIIDIRIELLIILINWIIDYLIRGFD